jgi:DNA-binding HxlR family transcriptional regulator
MTIPKPGVPVRGSRTGRPVMALLDLLGRRTALRILWELARANRGLTFRALESAAETNPALLNTRLRELRAGGLIFHDADGYCLTERGLALVKLLLPLVEWANEWAGDSG